MIVPSPSYLDQKFVGLRQSAGYKTPHGQAAYIRHPSLRTVPRMKSCRLNIPKET